MITVRNVAGLKGKYSIFKGRKLEKYDEMVGLPQWEVDSTSIYFSTFRYV